MPFNLVECQQNCIYQGTKRPRIDSIRFSCVLSYTSALKVIMDIEPIYIEAKAAKYANRLPILSNFKEENLDTETCLEHQEHFQKLKGRPQICVIKIKVTQQLRTDMIFLKNIFFSVKFINRDFQLTSLVW